jgi:hypothetical protein
MMTSSAPAHMTMTMTVTAFDLDDFSLGAAESIWCCNWQCRGRQGWSQHKNAGGKSG